MGQKVNPVGFRVSVNKDWDSLWYDERGYAKNLISDIRIRNFINKQYKKCGISKVIIERAPGKVNLTIKTVKPGVLIGKKGADIDKIKLETEKIAKSPVNIKIVEVEKPDIDASVVAQKIAEQLENRASFKRVVKKSIQSAMRFGAQGIKVTCSGRLGGAEIARSETYKEGSVPLHTLRSNVDYALAEAHTTYGVIGVKVWICK